MAALIPPSPSHPGEPGPVARTADAWAGVAAQHLKEGERPQAIDALRAAVSLDPGHGAAGLLITTLHETGQVEEAFAEGQRYRRDGMLAPLAGEPRWTALLARSWDDIDAQRLRLGLRRLHRPAPGVP